MKEDYEPASVEWKTVQGICKIKLFGQTTRDEMLLENSTMNIHQAYFYIPHEQ